MARFRRRTVVSTEELDRAVELLSWHLRLAPQPFVRTIRTAELVADVVRFARGEPVQVHGAGGEMIVQPDGTLHQVFPEDDSNVVRLEEHMGPPSGRVR